MRGVRNSKNNGDNNRRFGSHAERAADRAQHAMNFGGVARAVIRWLGTVGPAQAEFEARLAVASSQRILRAKKASENEIKEKRIARRKTDDPARETQRSRAENTHDTPLRALPNMKDRGLKRRPLCRTAHEAGPNSNSRFIDMLAIFQAPSRLTICPGTTSSSDGIWIFGGLVAFSPLS